MPHSLLLPDIFRSDVKQLPPPQSAVPFEQMDPFRIKPVDETHIINLSRIVLDRRETFPSDRTLIPNTEGRKMSLLDDVYVGNIRNQFWHRCAEFVVQRNLEPTTRSMVADEMNRYFDFDFRLFTEAPVVRLGGCLALAANSLQFEFCPDQVLAGANYTLAASYSGIRARAMGIKNRKPRYIEHAEPGALVSGTLIFVDPSKQPQTVLRSDATASYVPN